MAKNLPPGHGGYRATSPAAKKKATGTGTKKSSESTGWVKRDTGTGQFVPAPPKSSKGGPTSAKKQPDSQEAGRDRPNGGTRLETQSGQPTSTASNPATTTALVRGQLHEIGKVDDVSNAKSQRGPFKGGWKPAPPKPPESVSKTPQPPPPTSSAGGASSKKTN